MKSVLRVLAAVVIVLLLSGILLLRSKFGHELGRQLLEARLGHVGSLDDDWRGAGDVSFYTPRGRLHAEHVRWDGSLRRALQGKLDGVTLILAEGRAQGDLDGDGNFSARLFLRQGMLSLRGHLGDDVEVEAEGDHLNAAPVSGEVKLRAHLLFSRQRHILVDAEGRDLSGQGVSARRVHLSADCVDERGILSLDAGDVRGAGQRLDRVKLQAHGSPGKIVVDALALDWRGERWRSLKPAELAGEKLTNLLLAHDDERLRIDADWPLGARVSGVLHLARVSSLHGNADFRLRWNARRSRQPLQVHFAEGPFDVELRTKISRHGLSRDQALDGKVVVARLQQGELREISGELRLSGTVAAPRLDGDLSASAETPLGKLPLQAKVSWGRELRARLRLQSPSLNAQAQAQVPLDLAQIARLDDWRRLPLTLDGEVRADAKLLPLPIEGSLAGTLQVRGNLSHPLPSAVLRGEKLRLSGDPVDVRLRLHDGVADIEHLELQHEGAIVRAEGQARLDGSAFDGRIAAHKLPLQRGRLAAFLDGEIALKLRRESGRYRGEVTLLDGLAQVGRLAVDRELQPVGPLEDVVFTDSKSDFQMQLLRAGEKSVFHARIGGPFLVRGSDVQLALKGTLDVNGAQVRGKIEGLPGGWIDLYGHRYAIERVELAFQGARPTVEVRLTRQVHQAAVHIDLHGDLDAPKVTLTSDPPLYDDAQLAALVMNGDLGARRDARDLAGALSSAVLGRIKRELLPQLPLDVFKLDDERIEAGTLFGERLYLAWVHNQVTPDMVRHMNHDQAQVELRLPRGWLLESLYGDQGVGSIDLSWMRRF